MRLALSLLGLLCAALPSYAQLTFSELADGKFQFTFVDSTSYGGKRLAVKTTASFEAGPTATSSYLKLVVQNLSDGVNNGAPDYAYGTITAFGFNYNNSLFTLMSGFTQSGSDTDGAFNFAREVPFSDNTIDLDAGADTSNTPKGIDGGYTGTFRFQFSGVKTNSHLGALFAGNESCYYQEDRADFYFRFQEVGKNGPDCESDKVFIELPKTPEPSTYAAFGGLFLVGLIGARRLRATNLR